MRISHRTPRVQILEVTEEPGAEELCWWVGIDTVDDFLGIYQPIDNALIELLLPGPSLALLAIPHGLMIIQGKIHPVRTKSDRVRERNW